MTDEGVRRNAGSWAPALCLALLAACGPDATVTGTGAGSGGATVHTVKIVLAGNGSVSSNPAGIDCGTVCTATFNEGTAITLSAKPADGWSFTGWSGACSGTSACVIVLKSNANATATFVAPGQPPPAPGPNPPPAPGPNPPPAPGPNPPPAPGPNPPPPTADECADLVPASVPPPAVAQVADPPSDGPCLRGVSDDGDGTFLLGTSTGTGPQGSLYKFFRIDGSSATRAGDTIGGGDETGVRVFSQPSGFSSFTLSGFSGASVLGTWSHDGKSVATAQIATGEQSVSRMPSSAVGVDPSGGTAAVKTYFTDDKGWITTYQRFDKNGVAETPEVQIDSGEHRVGGVGVALSGHALILTSAGNPNWEARWVARDGSPISGPFTLQGPTGPKFQFLLDGSLALGFVNDFSAPATNFLYRIEDGATIAGPLPDWLAPRAGNQLYAPRSGKAYATWGAGGQCGSDLEILAAASGKSCGCVKVPNLSASASVGRDGSLIVPHPGGTPGCSYDLYPKLLR